RSLVIALASHESHVARYYMRPTAYVAAATRAQYAIQHYPQAPAVEDAMAILVKADDALGMAELRDSADRVLQTNFPNSVYLKGGTRRADVPWWRLRDPNWRPRWPREPPDPRHRRVRHDRPQARRAPFGGRRSERSHASRCGLFRNQAHEGGLRSLAARRGGKTGCRAPGAHLPPRRGSVGRGGAGFRKG